MEGETVTRFSKSIAALLLGLLLWARPASAAIALVSSCNDPGGSPSCGSGVDTTGATLLIAVNGTNSATCPTDSGLNTWTQIVNRTGGGFGGTYTLCYVNNPSGTGAGHTFTCGGTLCGVTVGAYSGTDTAGPLDTSCGNTGGSPLGCAASVTPANNGSLIIAGTGGPISAGGTLSIDSGLTIQKQVQGTGGVSYGADFADLVQSTAAAIQPKWDDSAHDVGVVLVAVFKPGGGAPPASTPCIIGGGLVSSKCPGGDAPGGVQ
jgi:hypothetical protein